VPDIQIIDRDFKKYKLEEAGVLVEGAAEYRFENRVKVGMKLQYCYTVSAGYGESLALTPYIRLYF
jgi:hypothetical protein